MASFFGEVVHPSSRAFWLDDDDEDTDFDNNQQENKEFSIKWLISEPASIGDLLIVEGEMVVEFVKFSFLDKAIEICNISYNTGENTSKLYKTNDFCILIVNTKLNLTQAGEFTEQIIPILLKSNKILLLTNDHISHFKSSENSDKASLLRSLHSSKATNYNIKVPTLNQPNIVNGVNAGVLTYAELTNMDCTLYIVFTDTFMLDSMNSAPLTQLFSGILQKSLPSYTSANSSFFNKGNLYM